MYFTRGILITLECEIRVTCFDRETERQPQSGHYLFGCFARQTLCG